MRILRQQVAFKDLVAGVLTLDYIGALFASILFPLFLMPELGLVAIGMTMLISFHPYFLLYNVTLVTGFVVFVERGQRKILVNYAKRQVGNKVYGGQSSHLPLKLNMSGVIPPIFASSIILLPATIVGWFATGEGLRWLGEGPFRVWQNRTRGTWLGVTRRGRFAALASAKCTNEENYLLQKVARGLIGTNNVDHCARL